MEQLSQSFCLCPAHCISFNHSVAEHNEDLLKWPFEAMYRPIQLANYSGENGQLQLNWSGASVGIMLLMIGH